MSRAYMATRGLVLSTIVVAWAAGCSVMSPSAAPSGLQRQVSQGAKADAEGRAHAAASPMAMPARAVTGTKTSTASGEKAKASTAGHAAAAVPGTDITAIGDSVMLASSLALQQALPGIYIDAVVSRHTYAGLSVLQQLAASGGLRPVVVVGLGTNGGVTSQQVHQLMAIIGSSRKVVLVNTFVSLPYEHDTNNVLAAAARTYPNVVLADWYQTISGRTSLLWPDGIHPQPSGAKVYAAMIKAAVAQAVRPALSAAG
jgi:lysophospholipase L1-like esterase